MDHLNDWILGALFSTLMQHQLWSQVLPRRHHQIGTLQGPIRCLVHRLTHLQRYLLQHYDLHGARLPLG